MEKSNSISNLAKALILFHSKVEKIKKDANNPFFKSKYASLSNILDTIQPTLNESGLTFVQMPEEQNLLTTIIMHAESGEFIQASYEMKPVKFDPQSVGSAITYQKRYALSAALGLNIDEDDDANAASQPAKKEEKKELPWLNEGTKEFNGAVEKIKAGKSSIGALKAYFRISQEVADKLNALSNQQKAA